VHRGAITKQGSGLVRCAAIEAVGNYRAKRNEKLRADYHRIAERPGKYKARVAVAASSSLSCSTRCATRRPVPQHSLTSVSLGHGPTRARQTPWLTDLWCGHRF
jgi:hypothetical protein